MSLSPLKKARFLAQSVLQCKECLKHFNTALQSGTLINTLLQLVTIEYGRMLNHIEERSSTVDKLAFRMGEQIPGTEMYHTGTDECPMGFEVELSAAEWRRMTRRVIWNAVYGDSDRDPSLARLTGEYLQRQRQWHTMPIDGRMAGCGIRATRLTGLVCKWLIMLGGRWRRWGWIRGWIKPRLWNEVCFSALQIIVVLLHLRSMMAARSANDCSVLELSEHPRLNHFGYPTAVCEE